MISELVLFSTLAFLHILIGSAIILLLLLLCRSFNISAEMRSWIWLTGFFTATLVPFTLLTPDIKRQTDIDVISQLHFSNNASKQFNNATKPLTPIAPMNEQSSPYIINDNTDSSFNWHISAGFIYQFQQLLILFIVIWFCGSCWRCFFILRSMLASRKLLLSCQPLTTHNRLNNISANKLFISDRITSPSVMGLLSPKIILPQKMLKQLKDSQLISIILHEQAHVHRNDIRFGLLQEIISIIFWWSPVLRILNKKVHMERELACDLRAAKQLNSGKQYAQSLIDCAKLMVTQHNNLLAMGLFSQKKILSQRINEVLNSKNIQLPSKLLILCVCATLFLTIIETAQALSPKISVQQVESASKHFSPLSEADGEKLLNAVNNNNLAAIQALVKKGMDINTPINGDGTALIIAVRNNNFALVKNLLELGADVSQSSPGDGNPLIMAAMMNHLRLAKLLINNGAKVNAIVPGDETALINASHNGHMEMVKLLVENGADVNLGARTGWFNDFKTRTPLNMAKTQEVVNYLQQKGATQ